MLKKRKSQLWFTDFVIGTMIFLLVVIAYLYYTTNLSNQESILIGDLLTDAESLFSSVSLSGFPDDWENETVKSIGITNNNQRLNRTKFRNFENLDYDRTRALFGTVYDYFTFFENEDGTVLNLEGFCGIGDPEVNATFDVKSAYYYKDEGDSFLKDFMINYMDADIYNGDGGYLGDFEVLSNRLNSPNFNYGFVVIEHPQFPVGALNQYEANIENYVSTKGGLLLLSGEVVTGQAKELLGAKYYKISGQSESDRNSTVITEDLFLDFDLGENIVFRQAYYIRNDSIEDDFTEIVRFNIEDEIAVARWKYGLGNVFYFSDFDADYFSGNFIDEVTTAAAKWGNFNCNPLDLTKLEYNHLVKMDRFLIHEGKPVRMVLYLWN